MAVVVVVVIVVVVVDLRVFATSNSYLYSIPCIPIKVFRLHALFFLRTSNFFPRLDVLI